MPNFNKVILIGNVTRDMELRYLPDSQTPVCDFGLAINRTWTKDGNKMEEVCFVDITAFGRSAETLAQYVKKGDPLCVEGRLKLEQWEKDGEKRSKLKVIAESFQFLKGKSDESGYAGEPAPRPAAAKPSSTYRQRTPLPSSRPAPAPSASGADDEVDLPF